MYTYISFNGPYYTPNTGFLARSQRLPGPGSSGGVGRGILEVGVGRRGAVLSGGAVLFGGGAVQCRGGGGVLFGGADLTFRSPKDFSQLLILLARPRVGPHLDIKQKKIYFFLSLLQSLPRCPDYHIKGPMSCIYVNYVFHSFFDILKLIFVCRECIRHTFLYL